MQENEEPEYFPGDTHTVPTEHLTAEQAEEELKSFLGSPELAEMAKGFVMQDRISFESNEDSYAQEIRAKERAFYQGERKAAREVAVDVANTEVGETLEFPISHDSLIESIKVNLEAAQRGLRALEASIQGSRQLPNEATIRLSRENSVTFGGK